MEMKLKHLLTYQHYGQFYAPTFFIYPITFPH